MESHLDNLEKVVESVGDAGLLLNADKCGLVSKTVQFLGYEVSHAGIRPNRAYAERMREVPTPKTLGEIRQICGMFNFFRKCIPEYAKIMRPINDKMRGFNKDTSRNTPVDIGADGVNAIERVKEILSTRPVLAFPQWELIDTHPFKVYSDGSIDGFGVVIMQDQIDNNGAVTPRVILFDSRRTSPAERLYDSNRIELPCFLWICEKNKSILYPKIFHWYTDNRAMLAIHSMRAPRQIVSRWLNTITAYNFKVFYLKGNLNTCADFLSGLKTQQMRKYMTTTKARS